MITTIIYNSKLFERSSHQYVIIMITDIAQGVYSNHKVQSSKLIVQIIKFNVQTSKFKVQCSTCFFVV